jgi:hypothetical protein
MEPWEMRQAFSRKKNSQLLLMEASRRQRPCASDVEFIHASRSGQSSLARPRWYSVVEYASFYDRDNSSRGSGTFGNFSHFLLSKPRRTAMRYALLIATAVTLATPAFAEDVGVRVGPVGAGVTVGESHRDYDRDRTTTVIKEREPSERTTVIKKEREEPREKTIIKERE